MARKKVKLIRLKNKAKDKAKTNVNAGGNKQIVEFHRFPELPAELRWQIVEMALDEDRKQRPGRVVLLDTNTRRISPTLDLAKSPSPLLHVDKAFREIALKTYVKVDVILIGPSEIDQYGEEWDWYDNDNHLHYDDAIAQEVDQEADEAGSLEGCLYIDPKKEIFLTGSVPAQIAETSRFAGLTESAEDNPWRQPHCYITEPLTESACAKVSEIRQLAWDPVSVCGSCGGYHAPCCSHCFFEGRGGELALYDDVVFPSVKVHGFYVMGGERNPEQFLFDVSVLGGNEFLRKWEDRYFQPELQPHHDKAARRA